jgi:hypothetical protein
MDVITKQLIETLCKDIPTLKVTSVSGIITVTIKNIRCIEIEGLDIETKLLIYLAGIKAGLSCRI